MPAAVSAVAIAIHSRALVWHSQYKEIALRSMPALLLGAVAFFLMAGPEILYPSNINWLQTGDPAQHFLGWDFFRHSNWSFPIGLNPDYGMEISNSIVYSDSIPLLAILFKSISPILPDIFQYFGLWLFLCFLLQSLLGWKLTGLASSDNTVRLLGAGFFVFSPPMIWRLHGHLSLAGHFLILTGLYLVFRKENRGRWLMWAALLTVSALVHAYLLAMVALLWLTDLAQQMSISKRHIPHYIVRVLVSIILIGLISWQAGYFAVKEGISAINGYGSAQTNILSVFDPAINGYHSWSHILPDLPDNNSSNIFESFNYLGLGSILLVWISVVFFVRNRSDILKSVLRRKHLLFSLTGLALFAFSNKVQVGALSLEYPLPAPLLHVADIFRASARFFWPVFYMINFVAIYIIIHRMSILTAKYVLAVALCIQIVDTSSGWLEVRHKLAAGPGSKWPTNLGEPFWDRAASMYSKVKLSTPSNELLNWKDIAYYASTHRLATDAVYLARMDSVRLKTLQNHTLRSLRQGTYNSDTLYIVEDKDIEKVIVAINADEDLFARIDGLNVLAPGWAKCSNCPAVRWKLRLEDAVVPLGRGSAVSFSEGADGAKYLRDGWSNQEPWGTWSNGAVANVVLPLSFNDAQTILVNTNALVSPAHPNQDVELSINGTVAKTISLTEANGNRIEFAVPDAAKKVLKEFGYLRLQFRLLNAIAPRDIGLNGGDDRRLAIGLRLLLYIKRKRCSGTLAVAS